MLVAAQLSQNFPLRGLQDVVKKRKTAHHAHAPAEKMRMFNDATARTGPAAGDRTD
jgi:hypothetical protein